MFQALSLLLIAVAQVPVPTKPLVLPALFRRTSAISPEHNRLALGTIEEGVWILDLATQQVGLRVGPFASPIVCIAWSPDGTKLALHSRSGTLRVVDSATGSLISRIDTCQGQVAFAAGGDVVLVALGDRPAKLWPTKGGERIAALSVREGKQSTAMAVSRDGELVALGDEDSGIAVWKARTGERVHENLAIPRGRCAKAINALDFDAGGRRLAVGGSDPVVRLYELDSSTTAREFSHADADAFDDLEIGCVRFSPDGTRLLSTSMTWLEARVWDVTTGKLVDGFEWLGGLGCPMDAWFSSDGTRMTMALDCRSIRIGVPRPKPDDVRRRWVWYRSDGDVAWAEHQDRLEVRRISDGQVLVSMPTQKP